VSRLDFYCLNIAFNDIKGIDGEDMQNGARQMKSRTLVLAACLISLATLGEANAAGCLKGAAVGGVAGHYAGHHAVVGCMVGRHLTKQHAQQQAAQRQATQPQ